MGAKEDSNNTTIVVLNPKTTLSKYIKDIHIVLIIPPNIIKYNPTSGCPKYLHKYEPYHSTFLCIYNQKTSPSNENFLNTLTTNMLELYNTHVITNHMHNMSPKHKIKVTKKWRPTSKATNVTTNNRAPFLPNSLSMTYPHNTNHNYANTLMDDSSLHIGTSLGM